MPEENTNNTANTAETQSSSAGQEVSTAGITITESDGTTKIEVDPTDISLNEPAATDGAQETEPNTQGTAEGAKTDEGEGAVQTEISKQLQTEKEIKADLASKGVDFDALAKEYEASGELSEASMKKLADANYPKPVVDAYLEGLAARTEKFVNAVKGYAGGDEEFGRLQTYIASQDKETIDGFNAAINSGNLSQIKLTIAGLKAEMAKTHGTQNPTIMASRQVNSAEPQGYTSFEAMTKDMNDPRYNVDPVFTRQVYAKVKAATIF